MFVDIVKISVRAGAGGNGAVSFHREKYVASGGPDGGNGGRGGDVVFVADDNLSTLLDFRYKRKYVGETGGAGGAKKCSGRAAGDTIIRVPRGTLVKDADTGRIIADISGNEPVVIAKGGRGGAGNMNFATAKRQTPRFAKPGRPGQFYNLVLELKLLADVGLVGFPNVGKSSLISVVSAAKPEIASYPFTTITPVLGVVSAGETSFVMADIPGLIEGASDGLGLGHHFLRHVERCRLIIHVLDVSDSEQRGTANDYRKINHELSRFSAELAARGQIIALNKTDIATKEQIDDCIAFLEAEGVERGRIFPISAATTAGTKELIAAVAEQLAKLPPILTYEPEEIPLTEAEANPRPYTVNKLDADYYEIAGADAWLTPILEQADIDDYESLQYFQRVLRLNGIIDALKLAGVKEGDTVAVLDFEFEFVE